MSIKYPILIKTISKLSSRPFGLDGWAGWEKEIENAVDQDLENIKEKSNEDTGERSKQYGKINLCQ